ncbi:hypothetical protein [Plantactinospora sonchi]|uniref:Uncharacterized protein n=1 Tax=Plantactinospora sonchi TaxID=1544735 RepID=A0ABU7S0Z0_9ACTN
MTPAYSGPVVASGPAPWWVTGGDPTGGTGPTRTAALGDARVRADERGGTRR